MSLVSAKCPNCGASIQVDNERSEAFCSYCGSKVVVQEAVKLVKIDNSGDIKNFMEIAKTAIDSENGEEALLYANKVLEIDSTLSEAWLLKMKAIDLLGTLKDPRISEIITTGNLAIKQAKSDTVKKDVYEFYLYKMIAVFSLCEAQMSDTKLIKDLFEANVAVNAFTATQETLMSDVICATCFDTTKKTLDLRKQIPNDQIVPLGLTELVLETAKAWVGYTNSVSTRFNAIGGQVSEEYTSDYRRTLDKIKEGLPQEEKNKVSSQSIQNPSPSACYIATAVYGSYDCPEVWILRRFRDYTLDETLAGRLFIKAYYATSPTLVKWFGDTSWFQSSWRFILNKFVKNLKSRGYQDTPYHDKY